MAAVEDAESQPDHGPSHALDLADHPLNPALPIEELVQELVRPIAGLVGLRHLQLDTVEDARLGVLERYVG